MFLLNLGLRKLVHLSEKSLETISTLFAIYISVIN